MTQARCHLCYWICLLGLYVFPSVSWSHSLNQTKTSPCAYIPELRPLSHGTLISLCHMSCTHAPRARWTIPRRRRRSASLYHRRSAAAASRRLFALTCFLCRDPVPGTIRVGPRGLRERVQYLPFMFSAVPFHKNVTAHNSNKSIIKTFWDNNVPNK